jgi:hypothetical protein
LKYEEANHRTGYKPKRKNDHRSNNSGKNVEKHHTLSETRTSQRENILVPSPLENVSVNTLAEDLEASSNSDESEKAVELSIRVDDGQYSDISSVAGDDVNQISPVVEDARVSLESREMEAMEEVEVSIPTPSSSSTHIVTSTGDSNRKYEASSVGSEKLKAIKSSQDRRFILNIGRCKIRNMC